MARRRVLSLFSLSFLDVMAAGLGAVALVFLIINHAVQEHATETHRDSADRVSVLEEDVLNKRHQAAVLTTALRETEEEARRAEERAAALAGAIPAQDPEAGARLSEQEQRIAALQAELRSMEAEVQKSRETQADEADATRRYVGEGDRQYLTGVKVGGRHILIMVDASASMLDEKIVDIIRRRNMDDASKIESPKWQRALNTVDWITTQVPIDAYFQIYTFNTEVRPLLADTADQWQDTDNGRRLTAAVEALREVVPSGGTNLYRALAAAGRLQPRPDNIFLITDGLPTQGKKADRKGTVSGEKRLSLYFEALEALPRDLPVNTILFPVEGDPMAASAFWQLAYLTRGSLLSPSRDWP